MSETPPYATPWSWEKPDPSRSGASGDLSKLFKNEPVKEPGILSLGTPSALATVLAREVIQNAWDAAHILREQLHNTKLVNNSPPPPFEIRFAFRTATQDRRQALIEKLHLKDLANRLQSTDRKDLGLGSDTFLDRLGDPDAPLEYMIIEEEATCGMYGPWESDKSKMFKALLAIGFTTGLEGRGGSYGYGKAGLIRGSAIRTVIAYTCFQEQKDDPHITRRLLAMTYWGQHFFMNESFTGFARLGKSSGPDVVPLENEEADAFANDLGLAVRDPKCVTDLGTTFMLIEPTVQPQEVVTAIERSWWPALEEPSLQFGAYVTTDSEALYPKPRQDPTLQTFIDAYDIATTSSTGGKRVDLKGLGLLGLVSDIEGWSYADQTGDSKERQVDHCNLVALMRKPRMVVEYLRVGRATPPYVRGVFIANTEINDLLRDTEPKGHDAWDWKTEDTEETAKTTAKKVRDQIRNNVLKYRKELLPPVRPPEDVLLPEFDRLIRRILSGPGKRRPIPTTRPITIRPKAELVSCGLEEVLVKGTVTFALSEHYKGVEALMGVSIRYVFLEDDRSGERAVVRVRPPCGFAEENGTFNGRIRRHQSVTFQFETASYRADWSGRLVAEADIIATDRTEL